MALKEIKQVWNSVSIIDRGTLGASCIALDEKSYIVRLYSNAYWFSSCNMQSFVIQNISRIFVGVT